MDACVSFGARGKMACDRLRESFGARAGRWLVTACVVIAGVCRKMVRERQERDAPLRPRCLDPEPASARPAPRGPAPQTRPPR